MKCLILCKAIQQCLNYNGWLIKTMKTFKVVLFCFVVLLHATSYCMNSAVDSEPMRHQF